MKADFSKHTKKLIHLPTLEVSEIGQFIFDAAREPDPNVRKLASMTLDKNKKNACLWVRELRMKRIKWN